MNFSIAVSAFLLGTITFLYRYSFISKPGQKIAEKIPARFLIYLSPATFAAIVANNLIASQHVAPEQFKQKMIAAGLSVVVAYYSKSILVTLIFGLAALYWLKAV